MDWGTSEQKTEVSVVLSKAFIIEVKPPCMDKFQDSSYNNKLKGLKDMSYFVFCNNKDLFTLYFVITYGWVRE